MRTLKLSAEQWHSAYDILCQGLLPAEVAEQAPFYPSWCRVPPGGRARVHRHHEHEVFLILQGRGSMRVEAESQELGPGEAVAMGPFEDHELANLSETEELHFLALVWEQLPEAFGANRSRLAAEPRARRVLLTATPPTPNGDLHVGHLSGPYLGADIHRRYLKMRGVEALYLSGVDDHQTYVELKARQQGLGNTEVAERFGRAMAATLAGMEIEPDLFAQPSRSAHHVSLTQEVFLRLWQSGSIVAREAPTLYCESCQRFLFEAHVRGRCPFCGAGCDGNACEECGRPNDCVEILEPRCRSCGGEPVARPLERLYLPLAPHEATVREVLASASMNPHLASLGERMLEAGLPEIAVSQLGSWGIPVPIERFAEQKIYVWFEMAPGYLAAIQELLEARGSRESWRDLLTDAGTELVQFFGFDNGYYHSVLFPVIFRALDPALRLPSAFVVNEFYRYEGSKFSTSRNHAMWGQQLLARVAPDVARFYLAWDGPERVQSNFRFADLEATVERELIEGWNGWLLELGERLRSELAGVVPSAGAWSEDHQRFYQDLEATVAELAGCYEAAGFSPQRAARGLSELVRRSRRFASAERHWQGIAGRFEERRTAIALELLAAKTLALAAAPILPGFSARLLAELGYEPGQDGPRWESLPAFVPPGQRITGLAEPFFAFEREAVAGGSP
ncbi:MAG: class I tRNA ligase family protein [Thermoanaerobaculia bacterium]